MRVEVVFAEPEKQRVVAIELPAGATVADAIAHAARLPVFSDLDLNAYEVGVYGRVCDLDTSLQNLDRVEFYRALQVDAKTARRQRAARQSSKLS